MHLINYSWVQVVEAVAKFNEVSRNVHNPFVAKHIGN